MLEKIGLPAKPSVRGNSWVVDASHCQGCSSQFTFINRKHHCRRCGGIFCNTCTQQRMVLRGQGDSPVRICEPCKKIEEAARFESRYGGKTRAARGSSRLSAKNEDEILNQILGNDASSSSASFSASREAPVLDGRRDDMHSTSSVDETNLVQNAVGSVTPEELRKQAADEKKRYKILKGEGKSNEALKAFKRGKELERQADALEISIRKNRKKVLSSAETLNKDGLKESGRKSKGLSQVVKEKDDLTAELRELGWTDMDSKNDDKKTASMSLEGELSSLLGDTFQRANKDVGTSGIDKTQVIAHKRKALTLKREGKLAEAKEELKKAKVLEKQLEEQELLGGPEDYDDEISALIRSMGDDKQDELFGYDQEHGFDFNHLMGTAEDLGDDGNLEVTAEDLEDPEIAATLKSFGWSDDSDNLRDNVTQSVPSNREALLVEIQSLKREALVKKRAGNVAEAMALLKKAKLREKDLENLEDEVNNINSGNASVIQKDSMSQNIHPKKDMGSKVAPQNRLTIQKELLALKKKALTLRREGKLDEAEEELKKGRVLEQQLEDIDNSSNAKDRQVSIVSKDPSLAHESSDIHKSLPDGEEDVTDQDMNDPAYLSLLRSLGWNEDPESVSPQKTNENDKPVNISSRKSRSKGEIQRELLALKRKALALRREGKSDEAEEVLRSAKALETQMAEMEASKKEIQFESNKVKDEIIRAPLDDASEEGDTDDVTEKDMSDPALISVLKNLGWKDEEFEPVAAHRRVPNDIPDSAVHSPDAPAIPSSSSIPVVTTLGKEEVQQDRKRGQVGPLGEIGSLQKVGTKQGAAFIAPPSQSQNIMDLLTGDDRKASELPASKPQSTVNFPETHVQVETSSTTPGNLRSTEDHFASDASYQSGRNSHLGSLTRSPETLRSQENLTTEKKAEIVTAHEKPRTSETNSTQGLTSQNHPISLRQEVLARKRKAVALKREGKLLEAREELRQAKLLEKSLEAETKDAEPSAHNVSPSISNASQVQQKETRPTNMASKPLSGRDRFKLQQESLSHKRQAMKLRREGRMEEAEAEFELAKNLEAQLDEMASQNSTKSSVGMAEAVEGVVVEDLLDPQLLSALKAIGIEDATVASKGPEKPEPERVNVGKGENVIRERSQLEEQIKAEKLKAVNLKRAGRQAEALEALRRAKLFEKKLNSLGSS